MHFTTLVQTDNHNHLVSICTSCSTSSSQDWRSGLVILRKFTFEQCRAGNATHVSIPVGTKTEVDSI